MAFVSLVPSWKVTPERSQSRRVNPSGDHSHLSMTRRLGFPSQPTPIGDSSVRRSIAAFRPPESFPLRGIAVPIVSVVLVVEGEEDRVQAGIVSASSSAARTRQGAEARSNWDRAAERSIRAPCSLCHRFAQSGHMLEPTGRPWGRFHSPYIGRCRAPIQSVVQRPDFRAPVAGDRPATGSCGTTSSRPGARRRTTGRRPSTKPSGCPSERFESSWFSLSPDR